MFELVLPHLIGTRSAVQALLSEQQIPQRLDGNPLVLICRDLASATASFCDELVNETLVARGATSLVCVGAPDLFFNRLTEAAKRRSIADRIVSRNAIEVGA